ncbi:MAG: VTT domain-containing protein [Phycisphaerales bacterium]
MDEDSKPESSELTTQIREAGVKCPGCGFDLGAAAGSQCPECGLVLTEADVHRESVGEVVRRLGPAAVLGVLWMALPLVLGLTVFIGFRQEVADWLREQGDVTGVAVYIGAFMLAAGLGLLPTWTQAVIGGYAFGMWGGFGAAWAGFTLAAIVGYVVAKLVAGDRVEREIEAHAKAKAVRDALVGKSWIRTVGIVALVRAPFNSPFSLMNLALYAAETKFSAYVIGTALGMAPRTLVYTWIGSQVSDFDNVSQPRWVIITGVVSVVVVVMIVAQISNKALEKIGVKTKAGKTPST